MSIAGASARPNEPNPSYAGQLLWCNALEEQRVLWRSSVGNGEQTGYGRNIMCELRSHLPPSSEKFNEVLSSFSIESNDSPWINAERAIARPSPS
ncbi:MAG: hypothetical protein SW833_08510 [Cyanobacteriota bacterium]|nr:hypothetical protein [Cyanobacteriota bacterium]